MKTLERCKGCYELLDYGVRKDFCKKCRYELDIKRNILYKKEINSIAKELGRCPLCGKDVPLNKFVNCLQCRIKRRKRLK